MVCSECGQESCAKGELMCEDARTASMVKLEDLSPKATVRRLRQSLQSLAEDYQQCDAENRSLRMENARLKGQVEVLQEQWNRVSCSPRGESNSNE